ncbi:MAG: hypothetical protein BroJett011_19270 [Chloroflexota bacterium]|nr:MAG: hypothetical protein BroJett011_19270 [Chloroflexota bacterium]
MSIYLNQHDLLYIVETLRPSSAQPQRVVGQLQGDETRLETMLDEPRLFQRLMQHKELLPQISPWLFFTLLLRQARRDLEREAFTVEQRGRQKVVLFDADRVVELLAQKPIRDYLATMLASFTRLVHMTVLVEVRPGTWRGYRTHELDIEGMIRYSQTLDEAFRFAPHKRIAEVCLLLTGMFPEYLNDQTRYPASGQLRPRRGQVVQTMEAYEAYGKAFYRLAAEHELARREGVEETLLILSEQFILAKKVLTFLMNRYLQFSHYTLFEL